MRINKFLADMGVASRRHADKMIESCRVTVNGKPARASYDVKVGDIIEISFGARDFKAEVTSVAETVKKDDAAGLYKIIP